MWLRNKGSRAAWGGYLIREHSPHLPVGRPPGALRYRLPPWRSQTRRGGLLSKRLSEGIEELTGLLVVRLVQQGGIPKSSATPISVHISSHSGQSCLPKSQVLSYKTIASIPASPSQMPELSLVSGIQISRHYLPPEFMC